MEEGGVRMGLNALSGSCHRQESLAGFAPRPVWGPAPGGQASMSVPLANTFFERKKKR